MRITTGCNDSYAFVYCVHPICLYIFFARIKKTVRYIDMLDVIKKRSDDQIKQDSIDGWSNALVDSIKAGDQDDIETAIGTLELHDLDEDDISKIVKNGFSKDYVKAYKDDDEDEMNAIESMLYDAGFEFDYRRRISQRLPDIRRSFFRNGAVEFLISSKKLNRSNSRKALANCSVCVHGCSLEEILSSPPFSIRRKSFIMAGNYHDCGERFSVHRQRRTIL